MPDDLPPELQLVGEESKARLLELSESLRTQSSHGDWAVLAGAGVSAASGVPGWEGFLREAAERCGLPLGPVADDNYPQLAQDCLQATENPNDFWELAAARLCGDHAPSRAHELVVALPASLFLTTNFDCLLEPAHSRLQVREPRHIAYPELETRHGRDGRLVYLHGRCACDGTGPPRLDPTSTVFTLEGYDNAYAPTAGRLPVFISGVLQSLRVLFLGFSFSDFPMRRLLEEVRQAEATASRGGQVVRRQRHLAIVATGSREVAGDYGFAGLTYGVAPIYYFNEPEVGRHEAFLAILDWLVETTTVKTPAGDL